MTLKFLPTPLIVTLLLLQSTAQASSLVISKMGNGVTVIVKQDSAAELVGVDVWVKAGSSKETPENNGVSHFIEHLVFMGTSKRDAGEMDYEIESLGSTLDARTSRDWAHFSTTVSSRHLHEALDVLGDAITNARFREMDIEQERSVILDEISRKHANTMDCARDLLAEEIYGEHPYALPVEGTPESLKKITRQDILSFHRRHYIGPNVAVVLVGNIDAHQAVEEVGKAFQGLSSAQPETAETPPIPDITQKVKKHLIAQTGVNYLAIGFLGPDASQYKDVCATDLLLSYIGFGRINWLGSDLKDKRNLILSGKSDFLTQKYPGLISIVAAVTRDNTEKAEDAIFSKLAEIRTSGIPEDELYRAKGSLLGDYAFQNETYGGQASSIGFYFAASDPSFAYKYIECVQSITNEDIKRVANTYMNPDKSVVLTIGPNNGGSN